ncbi:MAG: aldehyde dehydrogenase family protein [Myxococcales bacterium]|nr:aldehyde dehydrogenase family protein [Myxococcales bacterium]
MTDATKSPPAFPAAKLFVNGEFVDPSDGATFDVVDPTTSAVCYRAPSASREDVERAVRAARKAFDEGKWATTSAASRAKIVRRFGEKLLERREAIALVETYENGKLYRDALAEDVSAAAGALQYFASLADKLTGETLPVRGDFLTYTLREPLGVVAAIVPWNFPLSLAAWKLGPALAAGNTVVLKPSELTPATAIMLAECARDAGIPAGVLNVVPGLGAVAGDALATHPDVDHVAFTGSTRTAKALLRASAESNLKTLSLELGGKSPQIILSDASLDEAVEACVWGIFSNKGEVCSAGSRVLVERSIYHWFVDRVAERAARIKLGDPRDPASEMGPMVSSRQLDNAMGFIARAIDGGARLVVGGERDESGANGAGYFLRPTVFADVRVGSELEQEEVFGPVLACVPFDSVDEAVRIANGVRYGLAAGVWTKDTARAHAIARRIRAGVVWLNTYDQFDTAAPFGGYKQSGWGRDLSPAAFDSYTQKKCVWTRL